MHEPSVCRKQVCEKYLANGIDVFWAFMDSEEVYDTIDRHGMWQMLRVYGLWSCRIIVESSAEFLFRKFGVCPGGK